MTRLPDILDCLESDSGYRLRFRLSPELEYFNGHFPEMPVLPGVVQLDWAIACAKAYLDFPEDYRVKELAVLKFQQLMLPGMEITLHLQRQGDNKCTFSYSSEKGQHASGRIIFEASG